MTDDSLASRNPVAVRAESGFAYRIFCDGGESGSLGLLVEVAHNVDCPWWQAKQRLEQSRRTELMKIRAEMSRES